MKMIIREKNKLHLSKLLKYFLIRPKRNLFQMIFFPAFKKGPFSPVVRMLSKLGPMFAGSKPPQSERGDAASFSLVSFCEKDNSEQFPYKSHS